MTLDLDLKKRLIDAAVASIVEHADELTELDRAIGDADHGLNMRRGFQAIGENRDALAAESLPGLLQKAGMTLVLKVGGASGPLYGSLLMAMGKACAQDPATPAEIGKMLAEGVDAVRKRGRSDAGAKTMLDVLVPVLAVFQDQTGVPAGAASLIAAILDAAKAGVESTRDMTATKGRASFLGERSRGHLDPGARSSQLLIQAIVETVLSDRKVAGTEAA
jgi:phosphoenolpyruvate---glycerone phosphotransferase subunit DhaL